MKFVSLHGWPGYIVSEEGEIRSLDREVPCKGRKPKRLKGRTLTPFKDQDGYLYVTLSREGKTKKIKVHRAVNSSFNRPGLPGEVTRHLDGDITNNHPSNLSWGSQSDNEQDKISHGRHPKLAKTSCPRGHRLEGENLKITKGGHRSCRACANGGVFEFRHRDGPACRKTKEGASDFYYSKYKVGDRSPSLKNEIFNYLRSLK